MANKSESQDPFSFATLDDQHDVGPVKEKAARERKGHEPRDHNNPFADIGDYFSSLTFPGVLLAIWLVLFVLELIITGITTKDLAKWPVVMGDVNGIGLMKHLSTGVSHLAVTHKALSVILGFGVRLLGLVVLVVDAVTAGFLHASWSHLLLNMAIFLFAALALAFMRVSGKKTVVEWLKTGALSIGFVWLVLEIVSMFAQFLYQHPDKFIYAVWHSNIPILGASVGIYGLLGYVMMQGFRRQQISKWTLAIAIIALVLSVMFIYQQWANVVGINWAVNKNVALVMGAMMHTLGFVLGMLDGMRDRLRWER